MRTQKVSVNIWQMVISSLSYLVLALVAWIFLRLVQACFWFPSYLHKKEVELNSLVTEDSKKVKSGKEDKKKD